MTAIYEMSSNLTTAVQTFVIVFAINVLILFVTSKVSHRLGEMRNYKNYFFWFYFIVIVAIILFFTRQYAGIYNDMKEFFVALGIIFILIFNALIYFKNKVRRRQFHKVYIFLFLIYFISFFSILIFGGFFQPYDEVRNWESLGNRIMLNGKEISVTMQVNTQAVATQGFFPNTPLIIVIYEVNVHFSESISSNDSYLIKISTTPHAFFSKNETEISSLTSIELNNFKDKFTVTSTNLPEPWLLSYSYSGDKNISIELLINNQSLISNNKNLLTIEKGYIKSQVDTNRIVTIFTLWAILAALTIPIERTIDWWLDTHPDKKDDDNHIGYS